MFIKKVGMFLGVIFFWVLSLLMFAFSLASLISSAIVSGLIFMATAIVINPKFEKILKNRKIPYKKWMGILVLCIGFVTGIMNLPETNDDNSVVENENEEESTVNEDENYEEKEIDLNNLGNYPFGKVLDEALLTIGVDDAIEAVCEVDNASNTTIKVVTATKRLWIGLNGNLSDEREVEWIKDYDDSQLYYYISENMGYNEPIYSYKTNEILVDKVDGESKKYPYIVTASDLVTEINQNIDAAKDKYNGKWIEITGTVTYISDGGSMRGYYLYGKKGAEGLKITCWVENDVNQARVGEEKTFLGIVREITTVNNTEIGECTIVD